MMAKNAGERVYRFADDPEYVAAEALLNDFRGQLSKTERDISDLLFRTSAAEHKSQAAQQAEQLLNGRPIDELVADPPDDRMAIEKLKTKRGILISAVEAQTDIAERARRVARRRTIAAALPEVQEITMELAQCIIATGRAQIKGINMHDRVPELAGYSWPDELGPMFVGWIGNPFDAQSVIARWLRRACTSGMIPVTMIPSEWLDAWDNYGRELRGIKPKQTPKPKAPIPQPAGADDWTATT